MSDKKLWQRTSVPLQTPSLPGGAPTAPSSLWAQAVRIVFSLQCSSAASERVFSLVQDMFGTDQLRATLADQLQGAAMLKYNNRIPKRTVGSGWGEHPSHALSVKAAVHTSTAPQSSRTHQAAGPAGQGRAGQGRAGVGGRGSRTGTVQRFVAPIMYIFRTILLYCFCDGYSIS